MMIQRGRCYEPVGVQETDRDLGLTSEVDWLSIAARASIVLYTKTPVHCQNDPYQLINLIIWCRNRPYRIVLIMVSLR